MTIITLLLAHLLWQPDAAVHCTPPNGMAITTLLLTMTHSREPGLAAARQNNMLNRGSNRCCQLNCCISPMLQWCT
jgi:hypothetical protein